MTQETKSNLVYTIVVIMSVLGIAGLAQLNVDLAFGLVLFLMVLSVGWFLIHAIRTWSKTHIITKCSAVYGFVLMVYWCGYLQEYYDKQGRVSFVNDPCLLEVEDSIQMTLGETVTLRGWVVDCGSGSEVVFGSVR